MSQSGQERTERPTPKRLADARKKGQVPRSRELTTAAVMLTSAAALFVFGDDMAGGVRDVMADALTMERQSLFDDRATVRAFAEAIAAALRSLAPFFVVVVLAAIAAPTLTGGWSFSLQAMAPKFSKLDPVKGLKRVFGANGLIELVKALAKFGFVGVVAVFTLHHLTGRLLGLGSMPVAAALNDAGNLILFALIVVSVPLLAIAAIDVPFQLYQHTKQLKMTRQEVRDEHKETDGNPEVKGKIRQMQQERATRRMMEEVPKADVVITNPTHFAVALRYDPERMDAPQVVAKGADLIAARIREAAREHKVPLLSAPPLARALYRTTDLGQEIPARLYAAVAQVLSYVFQLRRADAHGGPAPAMPHIDVDESE